MDDTFSRERAWRARCGTANVARGGGASTLEETGHRSCLLFCIVHGRFTGAGTATHVRDASNGNCRYEGLGDC